MRGDGGTGKGEGVGFTLVEVLVVLALLGLIVGITGLAVASLEPPLESAGLVELRRARTEAVRTGRAVRHVFDRSPLPAQVLFLPDGSARGTGVDLLTGMPHAEP